MRALTYYRERARQASPTEREWLLSERLALWENAFVQAMLFTEAEVGHVWPDWGRPDDYADLVRVRDEWLQTWLASQMPLHFDAAADRVILDATLAYPGTQLRVRCLEALGMAAESADEATAQEILAHLVPTPVVPSIEGACLSRREGQIAYLVARGLSNRKIAAQLGITIGTVTCTSSTS